MEFKENLRILKKHFEVFTNKELAEKLGITENGVRAWTRKKEIPSKYLLLIDEEKKEYLAPKEKYQEEINRILNYLNPKATYYIYHEIKNIEKMNEQYKNYFEIDKKFEGMPNN